MPRWLCRLRHGPAYCDRASLRWIDEAESELSLYESLGAAMRSEKARKDHTNLMLGVAFALERIKCLLEPDPSEARDVQRGADGRDDGDV